MLFSCVHASAMKPKNNITEDQKLLNLSSSSLSLKEAFCYCETVTERYGPFFEFVMESVNGNFLDNYLGKLGSILSSDLTSLGAHEFLHEILKGCKSFQSDMSSFFYANKLVTDSELNLVKAIKGSVEDSTVYGCLPLIAKIRCNSYSIAYNNLIKAIPPFILSTKKIAELGNITGLPSQTKECVKDLQKFVDDNIHLLHQMKEFGKQK